MSGATALVVGTFIGTYVNNKQFRTQIDKGIQMVLGSGVDAVNKLGGGINVPGERAISIPDEETDS